MAQQQVQSKDMPPRFSKKGQLNADEVRASGGGVGSRCWIVCVPSDYKKTRYSEEHNLLPVSPPPPLLSLISVFPILPFFSSLHSGSLSADCDYEI